MMCKLLEVRRSGFYDHLHRLSNTDPRQKFIESCKPFIRAVFSGSKGTYGARRMKKALLGEHQIVVSRRTISAVMAELGLYAKSPKAKCKTTITSASKVRYAPDLLRRNFSATYPGESLVGDITYIRTKGGFLYLATVIDCFSKAVAGWAIDDNMETSLITSALQMAQARITVTPGETLFHSDRGSQYSSKAFRATLERLGINQSQGRTGSAFDNAGKSSSPCSAQRL